MSAEKTEKGLAEIFTDVLLRVKQHVEVPLFMDALTRNKRKYKELAKIGLTPDYEITLSGTVQDPEDIFSGYLHVLYECIKEKAGTETARKEMEDVLEHVIATTENPVMVRVAKIFLTEIRMERSPEEEIAERLMRYKFEGYPVEEIVAEKEKMSKEAFRKAFEDFEARIAKLKDFERQLEEMDTTGFENTVKEIRANLKNPSAVEDIEKKMEKIISGANLEKMEGEIEKISSVLDNIEKKFVKAEKREIKPVSARVDRANGKKEGKINGMVAKTRNGRSVNGRVGAVNGLTNGTNMKAGLAILVFLLLLIPPIMILMGPAEMRKIDGTIDDWGAITPVEQVPSGMPVPITKYAMDMDDKYVYFYVQVQSPHGVFESKGNYRDNVVLFLDMGVAGYVIDGIQAKYKIEVSGSDGNVVSSSLSEYAGTGFDWNWTPKGSIEAKANIDTLEGRIKKADIGNTEPVMYILIQRADGSMGRSMIPMDKRMHGVSVTQTGIASEIIEPGTDAQLLTFNVRAYGKDTVLTSINIKRTGAYDGALSVKVVDESGAEVGSTEIAAGSNSASVSMGRTITKNADAMYRVAANVSGVANNSVGVEIVSAVADGTVKIDGSSRTVYVGEPHGIIIDGAFGDWTNIPASWDPNDDVATPANLPVNPNLDINCTKHANDTAAAYFYAKVNGDTILAGLTQMYRGVAVPGNGRGTGSVVEMADLYDYAYINFTVGERGKEYSILIKGKNGEVLSKKVQSRDLDSAQWSEDTTMSNALTVACSGGELELGIPFTDGNITTYTVTMTDWQGKDTTSVIAVQRGMQTKTETETAEGEVKGLLHNPIHINGNSDFANQASANGCLVMVRREIRTLLMAMVLMVKEELTASG